MKKLLFTIMALSSFVWAELEEKSDEFKDMVSVGSEQVKSGTEDVIEEIEKFEKEEGSEGARNYISQGRYYEVRDKLINEVINLQKKCIDTLQDMFSGSKKGLGYAIDNVMHQTYLIKEITDYGLTGYYALITSPKALNEVMDLIKKHPNFLKKLYQAQSNLEYFQRIIIMIIDSVFFAQSFLKIDLAEYEKLDQLTDDEKRNFFTKQYDTAIKKGPQYDDILLKAEEIVDLMDKIKQGVNRLANY